MSRFALFAVCGITLILASCGTAPPSPDTRPTSAAASVRASERGSEVVLYTLGLIDTGYRFGGKNPEAGEAQRQRHRHRPRGTTDQAR